MEKRVNVLKKKSYNQILKLVFTSILIVAIIIGILIGSYIHYRDMIVESRKKDILNVVTQVSSQLQLYFNRKDQYLKGILKNSEFQEQFKSLSEGKQKNVQSVELLYRLQSEEYIALELINEEGKALKVYTDDKEYVYREGKDIKEAIKTQRDMYYVETNEDKSINIIHVININNKKCGFIRMKIDSRYIYNMYLEDYKLNNKGYISVKDKDGRLFLHPSNNGIGKNVVDVRRKQYPDYDWSELERVVNRQTKKERGVSIYHSIWAGENKWVKKICGFSPCNIGDTFIILNFSVDYEESLSILKGITTIITLVSTILIFTCILVIVYIYIVEVKKNKLTLESMYLNELKDKNALLMHQSKFAAMGQMLATIAHQLKQPLNALKISLYNIEDYHTFKENDENYLNTLLKSNHKYIDKMAETIDDFKFFFKPQNKDAKFNIYDATMFAVDLNMARINNLEIDVNIIGDKDLKCKGESNVFSQVILNLLNNSIDALKTTTEKRFVKILIEENGNDTVVELIDNGGGIKKEMLNRLFSPYATTKGENGTGLGLYISKIILKEKFNGDLFIEDIGNGVKATIIIN